MKLTDFVLFMTMAVAAVMQAQTTTSSSSFSPASSDRSHAALRTEGAEAVSAAATDGQEVAPATLLPALPDLQPQKTSIVGGTVEKLDRLRDQITLRVFGGGKMKIEFDPRTSIYKADGKGTASDLRAGDHVSIDTVLDGSNIFARNIRVEASGAGESEGVVVRYSATRGELIVHDVISPRPLKVHVTDQTKVTDHGNAVAIGAVRPGTLVTLQFDAQRNGLNRARQIGVLAVPGEAFTFVGRITALDLSSGLLVLTSATDGKTYEIHFDPATEGNDRLREASDVGVLTRFNGQRYVAENISLK
jgi:hypothetical protein